MLGQAFTAQAGTLHSATFWVGRQGESVTGNATALLYAATGTYGTDMVGTGIPLATSAPQDMGQVPTEEENGYEFWPLTFTFDDSDGRVSTA